MNRKRALISDTFKVKKRRNGTEQFGVVCAGDGPKDIRSTLQYLMTLFPRKLFNDALPQIVLKHQLYSIHHDKTSVDKEVNKMRETAELLMFQLGFDSEAYGLIFASDFKAKVLAAEEGKGTRATVEKFLEKLLTSSCTDLSFSKDKMIRELLFTDSEITQLVKSGLLTVRDAGSWWLSIPNSGKFAKYFIQGRKAVLAMVKKSKYSEVLQAELEERRTTSHVKFHMKYHVHDIVGADLVESIPTTSGALLRFVDS
ncbi:serine/threonine-protein kinase 19 [Pleuronectes platessa]|uniref:serine/threonine-protein kinase 19 n=1 Tax=Pleuronectes platessa TaxID=8262 RepID=UPI00232A34E0|nr:serine/threonine-protein kinase 19 [Pleuronectes platessa]XP_053298761.1 serine/threonine-protein kinase 19 [Pleuronectes platessa]XP_053298762.1 serine/threonine-protein kinase 19 [Pleuronectes platessa]